MTAFNVSTALLGLLISAQIGRAADPLDTWISSNPLPQIGLSAIAYAQEEFVAVGWPGAILTSADGVNWVQRQSNIQAGTNSELYGLAYGNGQFVAVGVTAIGGTIVRGFTGTIATSTDGVSWVQRQSGTQSPLKGLAYGNGQFVVVNNFDATLLTSADGVNLFLSTGIFLATFTTGFGQPTITKQPTNQTASLFADATYRASATGTSPLSYQWRFNDADLLGMTKTTLTVTNVQKANAGNYNVIVTNPSGSVTSQVATLGIVPFNSLYFFGSSWTDTRGINCGWDLPEYFMRRACNHPLWPEYLSTNLGLAYVAANNFAHCAAASFTALILSDPPTKKKSNNQI